mmetsp:Transcript_15594/g.54162  ORF Transcript_15594/g.54162 Transcript_15594/m.54162 type:complete len:218 (+) Transcript_15594:389-1042(+)
MLSRAGAGAVRSCGAFFNAARVGAPPAIARPFSLGRWLASAVWVFCGRRVWRAGAGASTRQPVSHPPPRALSAEARLQVPAPRDTRVLRLLITAGCFSEARRRRLWQFRRRRSPGAAHCDANFPAREPRRMVGSPVRFSKAAAAWSTTLPGAPHCDPQHGQSTRRRGRLASIIPSLLFPSRRAGLCKGGRRSEPMLEFLAVSIGVPDWERDPPSVAL